MFALILGGKHLVAIGEYVDYYLFWQLVREVLQYCRVTLNHS